MKALDWPPARPHARDPLWHLFHLLGKRKRPAQMVEVLQVHALLLQLAERGIDLRDEKELHTLLAPLLCTSPEEQDEFALIFGRWVTEVKEAREAPPVPEEKRGQSRPDVVDSDSESPRRSHPPVEPGVFSPWQSWFLRHWRALTFGLLALAALVALGMTAFRGDTKPVDGTSPHTPDKPMPGDTTQTPDAPKQPAEKTPPAASSTLSSAPTPPRFSFSTTLMAGSLMLGGIAAGWILWRMWRRYQEARALQFLERRQAEGRPSDWKSSVPSRMAAEVTRRRELATVAQQFRRRELYDTTELDVERTVRETVRAGGYLTPVTRQLQIVPEYLILIDQAMEDDHQALHHQEMVSLLAEAGLPAVAYTFRGDPRLCYPWSAGGRLPLVDEVRTLSKLAAWHAEHRLLIFSEGQAFIDGYTGRPAGWLRSLEAWPRRALITPRARRHWGREETLLEETKLALFPATVNGLREAAHFFADDLRDIPVEKWWRPPVPESLQADPSAWLGPTPPDPATLQQMLADLRAHLGENGWYWMRASAVYPLLTPDITQALGHELKGMDDQPLYTEERQADLSALLWFRESWIPSWLATALVSSLTPAQIAEISAALNFILAHGETSGAESGVLRPDPPSRWQTLRNIFSRSKPLTTREAVFIDVLRGRKLRQGSYLLHAQNGDGKTRTFLQDIVDEVKLYFQTVWEVMTNSTPVVFRFGGGNVELAVSPGSYLFKVGRWKVELRVLPPIFQSTLAFVRKLASKEGRRELGHGTLDLFFGPRPLGTPLFPLAPRIQQAFAWPRNHPYPVTPEGFETPPAPAAVAVMGWSKDRPAWRFMVDWVLAFVTASALGFLSPWRESMTVPWSWAPYLGSCLPALLLLPFFQGIALWRAMRMPLLRWMVPSYGALLLCSAAGIGRLSVTALDQLGLPSGPYSEYGGIIVCSVLVGVAQTIAWRGLLRDLGYGVLAVVVGMGLVASLGTSAVFSEAQGKAAREIASKREHEESKNYLRELIRKAQQDLEKITQRIAYEQRTGTRDRQSEDLQLEATELERRIAEMEAQLERADDPPALETLAASIDALRQETTGISANAPTAIVPKEPVQPLAVWRHPLCVAAAMPVLMGMLSSLLILLGRPRIRNAMQPSIIPRWSPVHHGWQYLVEWAVLVSCAVAIASLFEIPARSEWAVLLVTSVFGITLERSTSRFSLFRWMLASCAVLLIFNWLLRKTALADLLNDPRNIGGLALAFFAGGALLGVSQASAWLERRRMLWCWPVTLIITAVALLGVNEVFDKRELILIPCLLGLYALFPILARWDLGLLVSRVWHGVIHVIPWRRTGTVSKDPAFMSELGAHLLEVALGPNLAGLPLFPLLPRVVQTFVWPRGYPQPITPEGYQAEPDTAQAAAPMMGWRKDRPVWRFLVEWVLAFVAAASCGLLLSWPNTANALQSWEAYFGTPLVFFMVLTLFQSIVLWRAARMPLVRWLLPTGAAVAVCFIAGAIWLDATRADRIDLPPSTFAVHGLVILVTAILGMAHAFAWRGLLRDTGYALLSCLLGVGLVFTMSAMALLPSLMPSEQGRRAARVLLDGADSIVLRSVLAPGLDPKLLANERNNPIPTLAASEKPLVPAIPFHMLGLYAMLASLISSLVSGLLLLLGRPRTKLSGPAATPPLWSPLHRGWQYLVEWLVWIACVYGVSQMTFPLTGGYLGESWAFLVIAAAFGITFERGILRFSLLIWILAFGTATSALVGLEAATSFLSTLEQRSSTWGPVAQFVICAVVLGIPQALSWRGRRRMLWSWPLTLILFGAAMAGFSVLVPRPFWPAMIFEIACVVLLVVLAREDLGFLFLRLMGKRSSLLSEARQRSEATQKRVSNLLVRQRVESLTYPQLQAVVKALDFESEMFQLGDLFGDVHAESLKHFPYHLGDERISEAIDRVLYADELVDALDHGLEASDLDALVKSTFGVPLTQIASSGLPFREQILEVMHVAQRGGMREFVTRAHKVMPENTLLRHFIRLHSEFTIDLPRRSEEPLPTHLKVLLAGVFREALSSKDITAWFDRQFSDVPPLLRGSDPPLQNALVNMFGELHSEQRLTELVVKFDRDFPGNLNLHRFVTAYDEWMIAQFGEDAHTIGTLLLPASAGSMSGVAAADDLPFKLYSPLNLSEHFLRTRSALLANPYYGIWGTPGEPLLPVHRVTLLSVFRDFLKAARRTLRSRAILRWGDDGKGVPRLIHPNGICLIGTWKMDADYSGPRYTGCLAPGSISPIIARISAAEGETRGGEWRSLGLAGVLFPDAGNADERLNRTASLFTQEDLGGSRTQSILEAIFTNSPPLTPWRRGKGLLSFIITSLAIFRADKMPAERQLYELAELGKVPGTPTSCPRFIRLRADTRQRPRVGDRTDIREEVLSFIYDRGNPQPQRTLVFHIEISEVGERTGWIAQRVRGQQWYRVGTLEFKEAVASRNGDFVFHVPHPPWRDDRNDPMSVHDEGLRRLHESSDAPSSRQPPPSPMEVDATNPEELLLHVRKLMDAGRNEEAESVLRTAIDDNEALHGSDHPTVRDYLRTLADLLEATNRPIEAEDALRQAMEIDEDTFTRSPSDIAADLRKRASLLQRSGRSSDADRLLEKLHERLAAQAKQSDVESTEPESSSPSQTPLHRDGSLSEPEATELVDVLVDAFGPEHFGQFLLYELNVQWDHISTVSKPSRARLEELVIWAKHESRLKDLLSAVARRAPSNRKLMEFVRRHQEYSFIPDADLPPELLKMLARVITDIFDIDKLRSWFYAEFGIRFHEVVSTVHQSFDNTANESIRWAMANGGLTEFVTRLVRDFPTNRLLRDFIRECASREDVANREAAEKPGKRLQQQKPELPKPTQSYSESMMGSVSKHSLMRKAHEVLDSLTVGNHPKLPFVNRATLRNHLKQMIQPASAWRVLSIHSSSTAGKTYSWYLIREVAEAIGQTPVYVDLDYGSGYTLWEAFKEISRSLFLDWEGVRRNMKTRGDSDENYAEGFWHAVDEKLRLEGTPCWLALDNLSSPAIRPDIMNILIPQLLKYLSAESRPMIFPILIGDNAHRVSQVTAWALHEEIAPLTEWDIEEYLRTWCLEQNREMSRKDIIKIAEDLISQLSFGSLRGGLGLMNKKLMEVLKTI